MGQLRELENSISKLPKSAVPKLSAYKKSVASIKKSTMDLVGDLQQFENGVQELISDASVNDANTARKFGAFEGQINSLREQAELISRGIDDLR